MHFTTLFEPVLTISIDKITNSKKEPALRELKVESEKSEKSEKSECIMLNDSLTTRSCLRKPLSIMFNRSLMSPESGFVVESFVSDGKTETLSQS
jgi:hypothetical protein